MENTTVIPGTNSVHPMNVYIAGLPSLYNDRSLRMLFEPFGGIVSAKMMCTSTRQPNRVKGTGFVLFEHEAAASAAIQALNGMMLEGDPIQVRLAKVASHSPRHHAPPLSIPMPHQPQFQASNHAPGPMHLGKPSTVDQQQPKMMPASVFQQQAPPQQIQPHNGFMPMQQPQPQQIIVVQVPQQQQPPQLVMMQQPQQPQQQQQQFPPLPPGAHYVIVQ